LPVRRVLAERDQQVGHGPLGSGEVDAVGAVDELELGAAAVGPGGLVGLGMGGSGHVAAFRLRLGGRAGLSGLGRVVTG
jgi:hypothetical protein